ncbi:PLDc N-terminal domain-containing protein [Actinoplanes sp. NPDC049548]|uniref:PLDc N-terminal domain-containing protein n=1 Tax=Actinoplanes sp. NPDC049548 TaxID=3155152 RepID=UPI00343DFCDD
MDWSPGSLFLLTALGCLWFGIIWTFIAVFNDLFRRPMPGWLKACWVALIVVLPLLGTLIYLVTHASRPQKEAPVRDARAADEIATAARLHDEGRISVEEFEYLKGRALGLH